MVRVCFWGASVGLCFLGDWFLVSLAFTQGLQGSVFSQEMAQQDQVTSSRLLSVGSNQMDRSHRPNGEIFVGLPKATTKRSASAGSVDQTHKRKTTKSRVRFAALTVSRVSRVGSARSGGFRVGLCSMRRCHTCRHQFICPGLRGD